MPDEEAAAEAFGILSDPTRIAILEAFAEALDRADLGDESMPVLSFSAVYDAVDVDSTSRLSYHLEKLDGTYLQHTDEGWQFTFAGEAIVRLVLSGAYAGSVEFDPVEIGGRCPFCEAERLRVRVDDLMLFRECVDCERLTGGFSVTPAQLRDRDATSLLESTKAQMVSAFWRFRSAVCTECGGATEVEVRETPAAGAPNDLIVTGRCMQCWRVLNGPPSLWLSNHPASVAFHWDRGVDVLSFGLHEVTERLMSGEWRTERVDDGEYEVSYRVSDAILRLRTDDDLSVLSAERVRRDPMSE